MEEIPGQLILNRDQTGVKTVPSLTWTMERRGERRVEMAGLNELQFFAVPNQENFCLSSSFIQTRQLVVILNTCFHLSGMSHSHVNTGSKEDTMEQYVDNIILPYVEKVQEEVGAEKAALMIMDNFKGPDNN